MTFQITPNPTFTADVELSQPGRAKPVVVKVTYRHKDKEGVRDYFSSLKDREDIDALDEIIDGWDGFSEKYSREALGSLLSNYITAAGELFEAYRREVLESRAKN